MTSHVFTLPASLSVGEAAWALMHRGVSGAPVRDAQGRLVGVVANADLIDPERGGMLETWSADGTAATVADVMTPALLAVDPADAAMDAVQLMVAHAVHRVLVLDAGGELVGIVTPMDFLRRVLEEGHLEAEEERPQPQAPVTHH